jgi:hypothetical protein
VIGPQARGVLDAGLALVDMQHRPARELQQRPLAGRERDLLRTACLAPIAPFAQLERTV